MKSITTCYIFQLSKAKKQELILIDFEEGQLHFPPTFKYDVGTNRYDTRYDNSLLNELVWEIKPM